MSEVGVGSSFIAKRSVRCKKNGPLYETKVFGTILKLIKILKVSQSGYYISLFTN